MSNYTKLVNFAAKDTLPSGDAAKVVRGTEINTEFTNIATAVNSKADVASPTFTGTPSAPTATTGTNTTQLATTAFVTAAVGSTSTDLVLDTSPQLGGNLASNGSDIEMADNDKIKLGADGDLEIYHNGTDTVIADAGTGILKYTSSEDGPAGVVFEIENTSSVSGSGSFVQFDDGTGTPAKVGGIAGSFYVLSGVDNSYVLLANPQGATTLTYAGVETLDTTATGIEVTGTVTATGGNSTNWNTAYSWGDHAGLYEDVQTAASQAEMEAGTETAIRSMSPLRVAQAISELAVSPSSNLAQEGYWKDNVTGLTVNWGRVTNLGTNSTQAVTFNQSFGTAGLVSFATYYENSIGLNDAVTTYGLTTSGMNVVNASGATVDINWLAIGY